MGEQGTSIEYTGELGEVVSERGNEFSGSGESFFVIFRPSDQNDPNQIPQCPMIRCGDLVEKSHVVERGSFAGYGLVQLLLHVNCERKVKKWLG